MTLVPLQDELTGGMRPARRPDGRGRLRVSHRLRERGEPAAGADGTPRRDLAMRAALGASHARLVRRLMIENGLLAYRRRARRRRQCDRGDRCSRT